MKTPGSDATTILRRRWRRVVLAGVLVLLLIGVLSDLGQDARDWIADLWDALRGSVAHNASPSTDRPELADDSTGATATGVAGLSRPGDVGVALELARYRGQTSAAGQNGGAIDGAVVGAGGSAGGGNPAGTPAALAALRSPDGLADTSVEFAATDQTLVGSSGAGVGGGGGPVGESGPFSTVPGGPFVNGTNGGPLAAGPNNDPPGSDPPGDSPVSAPEPGTLLLLGSAIAGYGVQRWWRR